MAVNEEANRPMLVPHLVVDDAAAALDFYAKAFDAEEMTRIPGPGGKLIHACMRINGAQVFLNDDFPEFNCGKSSTPAALGGSAVTLHLHGPDVEARFARALDAGATVVNPLEDQFWGDRYGVVRDPFGHLWSLAETVREVDMAELTTQMASDGQGM
ncbi:VOC family protein [Mycobacterium sp. smrl_JER01]|uniref:VOC family protein n=1 Tax=Mycobacterium sp. smrl_JER01 TaxID=3402633 RepID=UPI003AC691A3